MGYFSGVHEFIQQPILLFLLDVEELDTMFLKNLPHQHNRVLA